MKIGLDFDGVVTYMPQFLSMLSHMKGTEVYIITGKRQKGEKEIKHMLNKLNIKHKGIYCTSDGSPTNQEKIIQHKVYWCKLLKIDIYIEDNEEIAKGIDYQTDTYILKRL